MHGFGVTVTAAACEAGFREESNFALPFSQRAIVMCRLEQGSII
jgi:hypothetical protein